MFPQTRIELTTAPKSQIRLDIKGVGQPLRPRSTVQSDRRRAFEDGPEDGTFYAGPLEDVLKKFGYSEQPLPAT